MKIKKRIEDAVNKQINAELYSAYLYLSMAAYFDSINLKGFSHWMKLQAKEETEHAMKFYGYLYDRMGTVTLTAIQKPEGVWKTPLAAFQEVLKHEQKVTALINGLVDLAASEKDHATDSYLKWFVDEQVEEESHADEIMQKLKKIGESNMGLIMLDKHLGKRE